VTYAISGSITPASVGSGATVALGGGSSAATTADSNGNYSFNGLANGSYTVTATKSGASFSPSNQAVTINGANRSAVNFTSQAATYTISGSITPGSLGFGATVALGGTSSATTTADNNGNYSFTSVANGSYTVTPSKSGVSFNPSNQPVTINGTNQSAINFTAQTAAQSNVQLIQRAVNGNEGTTSSMSLAFPSSNTAGNFLIVEATTARPSGTLSISDSEGNTYVPASAPVTDTAQNVTSYLWYVPSCKAGAKTVTVTPGAPGAQEIHISEWSGLSASNPIDGTAAGTGTGTSATFTQQSGTWFARIAAFRSTTMSQNSISSTITPAISGTGATITLSREGNATTTADANGNYVFSGLANGSYVVTPTKAGYSFTPPSQSVAVSDASQSNINFTAESTTPTSQTVSASGADVSSVDFTASAQSSSITMDAKVFCKRNQCRLDDWNPSLQHGSEQRTTACVYCDRLSQRHEYNSEEPFRRRADMVAADARERPERHIRDLARVRYVTSTEYFGELGSFSERGLVDGGHQSCGREHERRGRLRRSMQ
jgi:hypothetical protein